MEGVFEIEDQSVKESQIVNFNLRSFGWPLDYRCIEANMQDMTRAM